MPALRWHLLKELKPLAATSCKEGVRMTDGRKDGGRATVRLSSDKRLSGPRSNNNAQLEAHDLKSPSAKEPGCWRAAHNSGGRPTVQWAPTHSEARWHEPEAHQMSQTGEQWQQAQERRQPLRPMVAAKTLARESPQAHQLW